MLARIPVARQESGLLSISLAALPHAGHETMAFPACMAFGPTNPAKPEKVSGLIDRVTYFNEETGFAVLKVNVGGHRDLVTGRRLPSLGQCRRVANRRGDLGP